MEIRSTEEARKNVEDFAKRLGNLLKQKKDLDLDIKALKTEYKEEGVPVSVVTKAFNMLKSRKKKTESQLFEEEVILEWLESNKEIDDTIGMLNSKD